jgi:hypothetical protein
MQRFFTIGRTALVLLVVAAVLGWWAMGQHTLVSAQNNPPKVLVTWVAQIQGNEGLYYSILDDEGNTLVQDKVGLLANSNDTNFRVCSVHWTGKRWIVIVDNGGKLSSRGLFKVIIQPDGTSGWYGVSAASDFIGNVITNQIDGSTSSDGCLTP